MAGRGEGEGGSEGKREKQNVKGREVARYGCIDVTE